MNYEKFKKIELTEAVRNLLADVYSSIYHWEGLPDGVRPEYIELNLALFGTAFLGHAFGQDLTCRADRAGAPDVYGLGSTPIINTLNGQAMVTDQTTTDDVYIKGSPAGVLVYANNTKSPDPLIQLFTDQLVEAILSLKANIIHSRYAPIYTVADDTIKRATESAMTDIINGKPVVIMANNILNEIEGVKQLDILNLTDVDRQDKIQYITKTIDDLLRWFLTAYGQAIQGNGKLAQQTVDEVNGSTSASFILPELGYRWRKRAADRVNELLGWSVSVKYNKPWAVETAKYTEDITDDLETESEETDSMTESEETDSETEPEPTQEEGDDDELLTK